MDVVHNFLNQNFSITLSSTYSPKCLGDIWRSMDNLLRQVWWLELLWLSIIFLRTITFQVLVVNRCYVFGYVFENTHWNFACDSVWSSCFPGTLTFNVQSEFVLEETCVIPSVALLFFRCSCDDVCFLGRCFLDIALLS